MSAGASALIVSVLVLAVIGVVYSRYDRYKHEKKAAFRRYWELKGYYFGAFDEAEAYDSSFLRYTRDIIVVVIFPESIGRVFPLFG